MRSTMGPSGTQLWHNESWTNETRSQNITIPTHLNESRGGYFKIPELKYRCVHLHGSNFTKSYHYTFFLMRNFVVWRNQWPIFNTVIHHVTIMITDCRLIRKPFSWSKIMKHLYNTKNNRNFVVYWSNMQFKKHN